MKFHSLSAEEALRTLQSREDGLSEKEAGQRIQIGRAHV